MLVSEGAESLGTLVIQTFCGIIVHDIGEACDSGIERGRRETWTSYPKAR